MRIAVAFKAVPDDQDVQVAADRSLDYSKAKETVSTYDLNAIELASQLAAATDGEAFGVTVGPKAIDDSKLKKNALARGLAHLYLAADDALAGLDAHQTAAALKAALEAAGGADLVVLGDGSADDYAQQVDAQLAEALGWPLVTAAAKVEIDGDMLKAVRALEDLSESVEVSLPAVVSVTPDVAEPRIPGMKDILAAGKKPQDAVAAPEVPAASLETVECLAPEQVARACEVHDASEDGAVEGLAAAIKAAL